MFLILLSDLLKYKDNMVVSITNLKIPRGLQEKLACVGKLGTLLIHKYDACHHARGHRE